MKRSSENREGMTWEEWAYSAAIPEPLTRGLGLPADRFNAETQCWEPVAPHRSPHGTPGYASLFRKERAAWRAGEDPAEWRILRS